MYNLSVLRAPYIQNFGSNLMKIDILLPCPKCGGKMYSTGYHSSLRILKSRTWHVCTNCDFERDTEDFKKTLWCA